MSRSNFELQIPQGQDIEALKAAIAAEYRLQEEPEQSLERSFLDSFDWRLHDAGGVMEYRRDARRGELLWLDRGSGELLHRLPLEQAPGFTDALPAGSLRDDLQPILEMRTLLPLLHIDSRLTTLRVLDDEEKTVVRLELDKAAFRAPDGQLSGELGTRVHLRPVRGYDTEFDHVARVCNELLARADGGLYESGLQAIGRRPGDYSSKLDYKLDPAERADQASNEIHLGLLDTMEANIVGSRENLDSEFLHDLRVACRRTRSALTQIKGVYDPEVLEDYKKRFAWLQQITGPTRDMDVYLLALDDYKQSLPVFLRDALEPLRGFLEAHHAEEQKAMARKLGSPHFRKLRKEWRLFLEAPVPTRPTAPNGGRPVQELADERIWKMYRRVLKEGRAIGDRSPPEDLHELRKSCKKLRYLMEFFQSLYPGKQIKTLVKVLKVLLDNLGNFQDLEVQSHTLQKFAGRMMEEGVGGRDTLLAMGCLIGDLSEHQQQARHEFARIFEGFDTPENGLLFKTLFRGRNGGAA